MVFQAAFLDSDRRDNLRLAFTSTTPRGRGGLTPQSSPRERNSRGFLFFPKTANSQKAVAQSPPSASKTSNSQSAGAKSRPSATNTRNSRHVETNCARDRARGGEALCHFAGLSLSPVRICARR